MRNAQNDIIALIDENGTEVVRYEYDAWGNPISTTGTLAGTIGKRNPFRYRGYYWDEETGMYYLESRYYDPEIRRFISADNVVITSLAGTNLYMYCGNNPVNMTDPSGKNAIDVLYAIRDKFQEMETQAGELGVLFGLGALALTIAIWGYENRDSILAIGHASISLGRQIVNTSVIYTLQFEKSLLSQSLIMDMVRRVQGKQKNEKYHLHHIVPQGSTKAFLAQLILRSGGIDVQSPANKVLLSEPFHTSLHTNIYYAWVDLNMVYAGYMARNCVSISSRGEYIYDQLDSMKSFLIKTDEFTQLFY